MSADRSRRVEAMLDRFLGTSLDADPPDDLLPSILRAVAADRARRATRFRLSPRVENVLVTLGTAALAAGVVAVPRLVATGGPSWLGRGIVGLANAIAAAADPVVAFAGSAARFDWAGRLVATLSEAAATVLFSSAQPILLLSLLAMTFTVILAGALLRPGRLGRGGWSRAHLLA